MENLDKYGEMATWLQIVDLSPVAIALCLLLAFIGFVAFGPYLNGRG